MAQAKKKVVKNTARSSKSEASKHARDWTPYENMGSQDKQQVMYLRWLEEEKKKKKR